MLTLYFNKQQKESSLCERLQKLGGDIFYTDYAGDIVNLLVNKPKAYRFLYDAQADLYIICDAWDYIHSDMVHAAFDKGLYLDQKQFIEDFVCDWFRGCWLPYFDAGCNFGVDLDDGVDLSNVRADHDDSCIYRWIYCFCFVPLGADSEESDEAMVNDGYDEKCEFSFGTVYTRDFELSECDELQSALRRADK